MKEGVITVSNIKLYSYHGCLEEEALIGGNYIVDVEIFTDYSLAAQNDLAFLLLPYSTMKA